MNQFSHERENWDSLVLRDPSGSIFDTWEWLFSYAKSRNDLSKTHIFLELTDGNEPVCAAAFRIVRKRDRYNIFGRNVLEFLSQGHADYNTIIVSPQSNSCDSSKILCDWLLHTSPTIDEINLRNVRDGARTSTILKELGFRVRLIDSSMNYYLSLSKDWDEQKAKFKRHLRHNLATKERNLMRDYPSAEFVVDRQPSDNRLDTFFALHGIRMKAKSKPTQLPLPINLRFHKELVRLSSEKEWIRLCYLMVGGEMVAAIYGFAFNGRFLHYGDGFLSDFAKYSPVSLLIGKAIRSSIEQGIYEFDFLRGKSTYKTYWTDQARYNQCFGIYIHSRNSLLKKVVVKTGRLAKMDHH